MDGSFFILPVKAFYLINLFKLQATLRHFDNKRKRGKRANLDKTTIKSKKKISQRNSSNVRNTYGAKSLINFGLLSEGNK